MAPPRPVGRGLWPTARRHRLTLLATVSYCGVLLVLWQQQLTERDGHVPAVHNTAGPGTSEGPTTPAVPISTGETGIAIAETTVFAIAETPVSSSGHPPVCPLGPVISAHSDGRLGNNLGEYASIYALGLRYNVTAVTTPRLLRNMYTKQAAGDSSSSMKKHPVFPNLSLPVVKDHCTKRHKPIHKQAFEELDGAAQRSQCWQISDFPQHIRLFWWYRDRLRREFTFRPSLTRAAQKKLRRVARGRTGLTFVGVHVRRTDYPRHLAKLFDGQSLNASFYQSAIDLCRKRYGQSVFIVTSDDLQWCRRHLAGPDVHVLGDWRAVSPGVELDLALLAACNHSIFDYGTFGFFGAFLAGGDMILADGYAKKEYDILRELRLGGISATYLDAAGRLLPHCIHCT